eukprot:2879713-Pyramimonas_sp.AAC.1
MFLGFSPFRVSDAPRQTRRSQIPPQESPRGPQEGPTRPNWAPKLPMRRPRRPKRTPRAVSYTHLTLPTILLV